MTAHVDAAALARAPWTARPADYKLIVDFFAGGGGASLGIELATGRSPDIAVNHDAEAVALHRINHPATVHLQNDVWSVFSVLDILIGHRRVGLFHASPDCKHFSKALGGRPVKRKIRDLAWVVPRFCRRFRPEVVTLENVEEFAGWGPLTQKIDGNGLPVFDLKGRPVMVPCKQRKGQTFHQWVAAMQRLGYRVEWRERRAFHDGAPTIRKRLFVIARCDGRPIVWPAAEFENPAVIVAMQLKGGEPRLTPWRTAAEIIDWTLPCPSIFDSAQAIKDLYGIRAIRPLAGNTLMRIARGVKRYVIDAAEPFIVRVAHGEADVNGKRRGTGEHPVTAPLPTQLASRDFALVQPFMARTDMQSAAARNGLGAMTEPTKTVTTAAGLALVAPHLMTMRNAQKPFNEVSKPTHAVTAEGAGLALVAAAVVNTRNGEREGQAPRVRDLTEPYPTVSAEGSQGAIAAVYVAQQNGGMVGHDARKPLSTTTIKGSQQTPVAAHLISLKGSERRDAPADEPSPAPTAQGNHIGAVAAALVKYYGTEQDPRLAEPLHAATTKHRFALEQLALAQPPLTDAQLVRAKEVAAFLRAHGCWDGGDLVTVHGFVIVDIGLRMLTPRELFRAQGFPDSYVIDRGLFLKDGRLIERKLSSTAQVRLVGNSVSPPQERALIAANCNSLRIERAAA